MTLQKTIEHQAIQFAERIIQALRGMSLDELVNMTSGKSLARAASGSTTTHRVAATSKAAPKPKPGPTGRVRRSARDISKMTEKIVTLVAQSAAGLRAEQIKAALGVEKKHIAKPILDALATGRITKKGAKRATTYFAGSNPAPKTRAKKTAAKK